MYVFPSAFPIFPHRKTKFVPDFGFQLSDMPLSLWYIIMSSLFKTRQKDPNRAVDATPHLTKLRPFQYWISQEWNLKPIRHYLSGPLGNPPARFLPSPKGK